MLRRIRRRDRGSRHRTTMNQQGYNAGRPGHILIVRPVQYSFCMAFPVLRAASDHRPLLAIARCEGSACGMVDRIQVSLHSGDALALRSRWRPAFRWLLPFPVMMTTDSFTLPAGRSPPFALTVCQVDRSVCVPGALPGPIGYHHIDCLSPWRGGARPEGCGERGILAYPPA